jgi:PPM family protein phosphatase
VPDDDAASWNNGYGDNYSGGYGDSQPGLSSPAGGGRGGADGSFGQGDAFGGEAAVRHKRRWPIMTSVLVLLVLVVGGGLFYGWTYVHSQYYIAQQNGHVVLFRGVDQSLAGISLSSPVQTYSDLPVSQLDSASLSVVSGSTAYTSQDAANQAISKMRQDVSQCHSEYAALAAWQVQEKTYTSDLATYNRLNTNAKKSAKKPTPPPAEPPVPSSGQCAPSTAFGIAASALPSQGGQPGGETTTPSPSGTPTASTSPRTSTSPAASTSPSPRKTA